MDINRQPTTFIVVCVSLVRVNGEHRRRAAVMMSGFERGGRMSGQRGATLIVALQDMTSEQSIWRGLGQVSQPTHSRKGLHGSNSIAFGYFWSLI